MWNKFVYYLKFFLLGCAESFMLFFTIPLMLTRWVDARNGRFAAPFILMITKLIGVSFKVEGKENLRKNEPTIFLMNHQSAIDIIANKKVLLVVGSFAGFMKSSMIWNPLFSIPAFLCDSIFVARGKSQGLFSASAVIAKSINLLTVKKINLQMFPEGTRNTSETLLPFKRGAFEIAFKAKVKVQPVIISKYSFIDHKNKVFGRGEIKIKFLPHLEITENETVESYKEHCYRVMSEAQNQV